MSLRSQSWFKYVVIVAGSVLVTTVLLTIFVLIRLDSALWQQYGFIDSIRIIYEDFYRQGHIYRLVMGAAAVILIAALVRAVVAILPCYAQSIQDKEAELEKQKQELAREKKELEARAQELEQKRRCYVDQIKNVEVKCRKLEKRISGLRGRIKQAVDLLKEEQPKVGQVRSLLKAAYKAKGEQIEASDSELGRLRAENEALFALQSENKQLKQQLSELEEEVSDLRQDKEQLQNNLEKYIEH